MGASNTIEPIALLNSKLLLVDVDQEIHSSVLRFRRIAQQAKRSDFTALLRQGKLSAAGSLVLRQIRYSNNRSLAVRGRDSRSSLEGENTPQRQDQRQTGRSGKAAGKPVAPSAPLTAGNQLRVRFANGEKQALLMIHNNSSFSK